MAVDRITLVEGPQVPGVLEPKDADSAHAPLGRDVSGKGFWSGCLGPVLLLPW